MGKTTFEALRDRGVDEILARSVSALGLTYNPVAVERTRAFLHLALLARFAAHGVEMFPDEKLRAQVAAALADLSPWRETVPALDRLALACECRAALIDGRAVTIAQLGALTGRGRTQIFDALAKRKGRRIGRRIAPIDARAIVVAFRAADTFSGSHRRTKKGHPQMLAKNQFVPKEGAKPLRILRAQKAASRSHCATPRRRSAQPPNARALLNGRKARPAGKGGSK